MSACCPPAGRAAPSPGWSRPYVPRCRAAPPSTRPSARAAQPGPPRVPSTRRAVSPTTEPEAEPGTLVLVEVSSAGAGADDGDRLDAIVLVLDSREGIADAAEVTRRVNVLGWPLLGYVSITHGAGG